MKAFSENSYHSLSFRFRRPCVRAARLKRKAESGRLLFSSTLFSVILNIFRIFYAFDIFRIKIYILSIGTPASHVLSLYRGNKGSLSPNRLGLFYFLYFFCERRSVEALETGTVRHRRDIVRRFDVEDQASQHIHFSDPLGDHAQVATPYLDETTA